MARLKFEELHMGLPVWAKEGGGWTKATVVLVPLVVFKEPGEDARGLKVKCALHRAGRNQASGFKYLDQLAPRDKEKKGADRPGKEGQ